jgi:hypothetical protein
MGLCQPEAYGCETHMLIVAEIVIGDHICTSPAYVLRAEYWVVDWVRTTSLRKFIYTDYLRSEILIKE